MTKATAEEIKADVPGVILGWCSYQQGGRVDGVRPDGYKCGQDGDAWDEEQWCFWTVEDAMVKYGELVRKADSTYAPRAIKQMRSWLIDIIWDSTPLGKFGEWDVMVGLEMYRFRCLVAREIEKNPRPIKITTPVRIDPKAREILNPEYKENRAKSV